MNPARSTLSTCRGRGGRPIVATALALLIPLVFVVWLVAPTGARAISRDSVLSRAQSWVDSPVPYSQARSHLGYRTDCSGYVSMCWATRTSWNTRSFYRVSHRISVAQLTPGDALLKKGYHIRLFYGWLDDTHTSYVAYEANTVVAVCRIHSLADDLAFGYVPTRYNHVSSSPRSRNLLRNGSFDVWAQSWSDGDLPVWWNVSGPWLQAVAEHRKDTYRTARNSLQLANLSEDPTTVTEMSQSAPVSAGVNYTLCAWAKTASNPASVSLCATYLDAAGNPLAETSTTAARCGVRATSFARMSVAATTPPKTVSVRVAVQLAGGTTPTSTVQGVVAGTSVTLDDISLTRRQVSVSIRTSSANVRSGKTVVLSGLVTPASAIGKAATLFVQRPRWGWIRVSTAAVRASGTTGTWRGAFAFKRGMSKGVYRFKTAVLGYPGYLGATSRSVSVRLK